MTLNKLYSNSEAENKSISDSRPENELILKSKPKNRLIFVKSKYINFNRDLFKYGELDHVLHRCSTAQNFALCLLVNLPGDADKSETLHQEKT